MEEESDSIYQWDLYVLRLILFESCWYVNLSSFSTKLSRMPSWGTGYRWHYYWTEQWILKNTKNLGGRNFDVFFRCVMFWKESCVITNNKFHFPRSEKCLILLKFKGSLRRPPSYTITVVNRFCNVHWVFSEVFSAFR